MPTAPKLIASICYCLIALVVAFVYQLDYPDQTFSKLYYAGSAGIGGLVGWYTLGQKPHFGGRHSLIAGVRGVVVMSIVGAILFGLYRVFAGMGEHAYVVPMQVPVSWIMTSIAYFKSALRVDIWAIMVIGGAMAGRITGRANRVWR